MSLGPAPPSLSPEQRSSLEELERLAREFNRKLNLYSDASTHDFRQRHIEHSLSLGTRAFPSGTHVVDWGTGGGMPGLPLAILFPKVVFHLVDSVAKKIRAVQAMARRLGLDNVRPWHGRAEEWTGQASFSVSRATAPLEVLWQWHERAFISPPSGADSSAVGSQWRPGLICLKGGNLTDEIAALHRRFPGLETRLTPLEHLAALKDKLIVEVYRQEGTGT